MSKVKYLGKFTDEGDTIDLPFDLESGKYRIEIKPVGESRRDRTVYVDLDGVMRLPNVNEKKALALGSNIFLIYKIVNDKRVLFWLNGNSSFSLFLKPKSEIIELDNQNSIKINFENESFLLKIVSHHNENVHSLQIEKI
jgi:hypothetical protein